MSVSIKMLTVGPVEENCYIVYRADDSRGECILVDPGAGGEKILKTMKALDKKPLAIYLTHGHYDHIMAVEWIRKEFPDIAVYAYEREREVLEDPAKSMVNLFSAKYVLGKVNYLEDGSVTDTAGIPFQLIATPGHTQGSCCWYLKDENILFSGDTLFLESVGRTDYPTGSRQMIRKSILERLRELPEETEVYPGHGEKTDIAHEKKFNFIMLGFF